MEDTIECPKCQTEHIPCGSHEDDSGEWQCEECGFKFMVEIEYDPSYWISCVIHKFGEFETRQTSSGKVECRFCEYCGKCELLDCLAEEKEHNG